MKVAEFHKISFTNVCATARFSSWAIVCMDYQPLIQHIAVS